MKANKVLFITQEITPYVPESEMANMGRFLPQAIQEKGREIRTFMPKWGNVNERRNQLHEVIRLSGMNLIIDDTDHPLIIKVASIQAARMQVYFIDNDDYFQHRLMTVDENGKELGDCAGDICDLKHLLVSKAKLLKGEHQITVTHSFHFDYLPNIIHIGLDVGKSK